MMLAALSFQTIDQWIEAGGYIALFGVLFACGLGLPLPEDIPLLVAGALVAKGNMHLLGAAIAGWCGIIGGDICLYFISRRIGLEVTRVRFIGKHLTRERIERVEGMFENYGVAVVGIGRMFAGVRGAMVVAAGVTRFNFTKFIITDGLGAIVSGGFFLFAGHWLGSRLNEKTIHEFKGYFVIGASVLVIGAVAFFLWRRKRPENTVEKLASKVHPSHDHSKDSAQETPLQ